MGLKKAMREWLGHVARFGVVKGTRIVRLKSRRSNDLARVEVPGGGGDFFDFRGRCNGGHGAFSLF